jgi:organic radical activating enzyme
MSNRDNILKHADEVLEHLYISPLEKCNLCCKICYTAKTSDILTPEAIVDFIHRYQQVHKLSSITFCGGEVMLLKVFPDLVNTMTDLGIFVQIITNGTADRLEEFKTPNSIDLIVSLDGQEPYHDSNRGAGNYRKSLTFLQKAQKLGFHYEIFSIATSENIPLIPEFEAKLTEELGELPDITYHPRKPMSYLDSHPVSNVVGEINGFNFPDQSQISALAHQKGIFPPPGLGCYQLSLMSTGKINACCEGIRALGDISSDIGEMIAQFYARLEEWMTKHPDSPTLGCVEPDFLCGLSDPPYTK